MIRLATLLALLSAAAPPGLGQEQAQPLPDSPATIPIPELREYAPPAPASFDLPGGARLLVLENRELPLVDGVLAFRAGSIHEPADKVGLVEMLCDALREGGSEQASGPELDDWLDLHAASIDVEGDLDRIDVRFSCLTEDLDGVLVRVRDLLASPAYPADVVEKSRARLLAGIERLWDDTGALADATALRVAYGFDSPLARRPTERSARSLSKADLEAFHAAHLGPDRLLIGVTGDVDGAALAKRLGELLEGLEPVGAPPAVEVPAMNSPKETEIYVLDRPGVTQTELRITAPGVTRDDSDYPGLYLWSNVVGIGGMTNRMMLKVRTELGLAYTVGCYWRPDWNRPGRFWAWCGTRNDAAGDALQNMLRVLNASTKARIPRLELALARERVLNSEVFRIDSPVELLERTVDLAFHGYPADHYEQVADAMKELWPEHVRQIMERRYPNHSLYVVAVGPLEEIERALSEIADVQVVPPEAGSVVVTEQAAKELERMFAALGGREALAGLAAIDMEVVTVLETARGRLEVPSRQWRSVTTPVLRLEQDVSGMKSVTAFDGSRGWQEGPTGVLELDAETINDLQRNHERWLYSVLGRLARGGELSVSLAEDGRLQIDADLGSLCWIELGEDGRPVSLGFGADKPPAFQYEEWQESGGIGYARKLRQRVPPTEITVEQFRPIAEIAPELLAHPAAGGGGR